MKKYLTAFILALFLTTSIYARTLEEIKKSGVLKIAVDGMTPPFNYYKGKELVGIEIDMAKEIAKRIGVKVEWVVKPFNTLLIALNQNRFDLIATSHAVTPERAKIVAFLNPHYCTGATIVTHKDGPKTAKDLKDKTVVVPVGTVYYAKLTDPKYGIKNLRTVPNETDGLQNLLNKRADAWVTDGFVAAEAVQKQKSANLVLGEVILPQKNAMAVSSGNKSLLDEVNNILASMNEDGTFAKLSKKYFKRDIRCVK